MEELFIMERWKPGGECSSVHSFTCVRTDLVTMISHEWLEQSR